MLFPWVLCNVTGLAAAKCGAMQATLVDMADFLPTMQAAFKAAGISRRDDVAALDMQPAGGGNETASE